MYKVDKLKLVKENHSNTNTTATPNSDMKSFHSNNSYSNSNHQLNSIFRNAQQFEISTFSIMNHHQSSEQRRRGMILRAWPIGSGDLFSNDDDERSSSIDEAAVKCSDTSICSDSDGITVREISTSDNVIALNWNDCLTMKRQGSRNIIDREAVIML